MTDEQMRRQTRVHEELALFAMTLDERTFDGLLLLADHEVKYDASFDGPAVAEWVPGALLDLARIRKAVRDVGSEDDVDGISSALRKMVAR